MTYLASCPFCGGPVRLVYDGTADGTCYGVSHRPGAMVPMTAYSLMIRPF